MSSINFHLEEQGQGMSGRFSAILVASCTIFYVATCTFTYGKSCASVCSGFFC
jgi:hypothetical protein